MSSDIRSLLKLYQGQILHPQDPGFEEIKTILNEQPTWKRHQQSIKKLKITVNGLNKLLYLFVQVIPGKWWRASWSTRPETRSRPEYQLNSAFRYAVRKQILEWKEKNQTEKKCQNCAAQTDLQADHAYPAFSSICTAFLKDQKDAAPFQFEYHQFGRKFKAIHRNFSDHWKAYHAAHSQLQWLCKKCNIAKGTKSTCEVKSI